MKLTGKCKEEFLKYINKSGIDLNKYGEKYKNAIIINWFKRNGIDIIFSRSKLGGCMVYFSNLSDEAGLDIIDIQNKTILRANELFNQKK